MDRRSRPPLTIGESLERWRRLAGVGAPSAMAGVQEAWEDVLGGLAGEVAPRALVDGTLLVEATEPASAEALRWRAETVVAALRDRLGDDSVRRIEVRSPRR